MKFLRHPTWGGGGRGGTEKALKLEQSFSTIDILARYLLVGGGCPVPCWLLATLVSSEDSSPDASSTLQLWQSKSSLDTETLDTSVQCPPSAKSAHTSPPPPSLPCWWTTELALYGACLTPTWNPGAVIQCPTLERWYRENKLCSQPEPCLFYDQAY